MQRVIIGVAAAAILAALAGCDSGAKAVGHEARVSPAESRAAAREAREVSNVDWAAGKNRTAEASAKAQFERNGEAFGSTSVEDYVAEAHAFAKKPPKGVEMATRRNGDVLLYDPARNIFGVYTADGSPRTLFKPRNGPAYWAQQKDSAQQQARGKAQSKTASRTQEEG